MSDQVKEATGTLSLVDPELLPIIDLLGRMQVDASMLPELRARPAPLGDAAAAGVTRRTVQIEGTVRDRAVRALVYTPIAAASDGRLRPAYVHFHGGGFVMGSPEGSDAANTRVAAELGAVVVSVDYRLAPEHPIPEPLEDAYAALAWVHESAPELGVDTTRIGIGGESAGGGLAAALAILARDRGDYAICHQHLTYPMLDDRTGTDEAPGDPLVGEFVWTRASNRFGWASFLGTAPRSAPQVPARVADVAGLPPTWLSTATLDLFRDENLHYAQRLMAAGIRTDLVVYPAACHNFQMVPDARLTARYIRDHLDALGHGLGATRG
jgi:acetyl esterase/lipase